eukprot:CAMPEP_0204518760 /NCGR_PEP_ID=MMETSP0661-20131031/4365_1 /ASSEMBLY_ACC=CAM_ASM_000606 /TAXON_ID=109239 /ORGANISM="Alexandrium margalefi, Strain AMGDE01CS-322" /LENGTH=978 /DNA_ID=CAMNT_0051524225 /DNA_START=45 /DNA_END=2979 /DNA_ORIENTATION=-
MAAEAAEDKNAINFEEEYERGYGSGPYGINQLQVAKGFVMNPFVTVVGFLLLWIFVIIVSVNPADALKGLGDGQTWVTKTFTWLYIISQDYWFFWLFPLSYYYGNVKLGKDDEKPEFSDMSYFSMVFCAGVAIGLIFYGCSEPLIYYTVKDNRYSNSGFANQNQIAQDAVNTTIFHWGLQAWVVYAVIAISMGLLSYRQGLPLTFRSTLAPLLGRAGWGWAGDMIDVITILTVVAGLCTSLGLGATQVLVGFQREGILPHDMNEGDKKRAASILIVCITLVATMSVVSGVNLGVKILSQTAFFLGNFILCAVFFMDRPWYLCNMMVQSLGYHFQYFLELSFFTDTFGQLKTGEGRATDGFGAGESWMDWWTIFYWGWWISWAPFVGTFLARISRGRTINNVLLYSMTVPFMYVILWFSTFGGVGLRMHRRAKRIQEIGKELFNNEEFFQHTTSAYRGSGAGNCYDVPKYLPFPYETEKKWMGDPGVAPVCIFKSADGSGYWFDVMNQYHGMGSFLAVVSIITILLYFVTSSDSGSLVVDLIAANGEEAHVVQRVLWALSEGLVAIAVINAGGDKSLKALRAMSIMMGLPFTVILMLAVTALWRALKIDQGHLPPRALRTEWKLPLYGGIFDILQKIWSLGKAPGPQGKSIPSFFIGLFCPPLIYMKILKKMNERQKEYSSAAEKVGLTYSQSLMSSPMEDAFMVVCAGVMYILFWLMHILCWSKVNDGFYGLAWTAYVFFCGIVGSTRYVVRTFYKIAGNPMEDFCAVAFLWPQALAQMAEQLEEDPPAPEAPQGPVVASELAARLDRRAMAQRVPPWLKYALAAEQRLTGLDEGPRNNAHHRLLREPSCSCGIGSSGSWAARVVDLLMRSCPSDSGDHPALNLKGAEALAKGTAASLKDAAVPCRAVSRKLRCAARRSTAVICNRAMPCYSRRQLCTPLHSAVGPRRVALHPVAMRGVATRQLQGRSHASMHAGMAC